MIKITFVRHGQTDWNLEGKLQGVTDIPLNSRGIDEAKSLKNRIKNEYKEIISSPLKRAYKTATIINEKLKLPINTEPLLVERDFGELVGKPKSYDNIMANSCDINGLESMESVRSRILTFLQTIVNRGRGHYLVVAHGGVIVTLLSIISKGEITWENSPIKNCSLTSVSFTNNWEIDYFSKIL